MARLIDADALNSAIEEWFDGVCVYDVSPSEAVNDFQSIVDEQPTLSPDEVQGVGEWIEKEVYNIENTTIEQMQSASCSVCGKIQTTPFLYYFYNFNYCPNCGARMTRAEAEKAMEGEKT